MPADSVLPPGHADTRAQLAAARRMLVWALITGAFVRALFILKVLPDFAFEDNGVFFLEMARSLREHGDPFAEGFHANRYDRGPFAAYVIGALATFMELVPAGRVMSALAGTALIALVYAIARRVVAHDARVAGLTALATAWFPLLVEYSVLAYDDMLACCLFTLALALLVRAADQPEQRLRHAALLGLVTALGYLTRPSGLTLVVVVVATWGVFAWSERAGVRGWLAASAITLLTFAVVSAPYVYYLSDLMGSFTLTAKSIANLIWITESPDRNWELAGDELVWVAAMRETTPAQYIAAHFRQFATAAVKGVQWMITDHIAHALSLPIAALGFYGFVHGRWTRARFVRELPIALGLLSLVAPLSVFGTLTPQFGRYLIPIIPLSLMYCAKAVYELSERTRNLPAARDARWPALVRHGAVALLLTYLAAGTIIGPGMKLGVGLDRPRLKASHAAGAWLAAHTPPDSVVCTSDTNLAFAAERSSVPQPMSASTEQITGYLDRYRVTHVALAERSAYPRFSAALTRDLQLVHSVSSGPHTIRIYQRDAAATTESATGDD